jgi:hypothetical protein
MTVWTIRQFICLLRHHLVLEIRVRHLKTQTHSQNTMAEKKKKKKKQQKNKKKK